MVMKSFIYWFFGIISVLMIVWIGASLYTVWGIEEPKYKVVAKKEGYEIRQYEPYLIAETDMPSVGSGFSILADYIFGKNKTQTDISMTAPVILDRNNVSSEKISMTSPVLIQKDKTKKSTMSFVMPSKYTMATIPEPIDKRVRLKQVEGRTIAVLQYSWIRSEKRYQRKAEKLIELLKRDNITLKSEPIYAGYNPPLTIPFLMRHEVWIDVEPIQ